MFQPRAAQAEVLNYKGGFMAVSAVPGSGKTVTLAALAAHLLEQDLAEDRTVLVVTYMNSAVDNLTSRIHSQLQEKHNPHGHYEVRTLHSLAREILLEQPGLAGVVSGFPVLDERMGLELLHTATDRWLLENPEIWEGLLEEVTPQGRDFWRQRIQEIIRTTVKEAKNRRWRPQDILARMGEAHWLQLDLLRMAVEVYEIYQSFVQTSGGLDFDDLVWRAVDLLEHHPDLLERLRWRWPFILEDEAQDSVPLQEELLGLLAGPRGNWVRVGDPNQAITSTFTAAHPRYFRAFMQREDVHTITMPETGRCAPKIMALANHLVSWTCRQHPLPEVRQRAFRLQYMLPVPENDPQPNPPDAESGISIYVKGYTHRERGELPRVAYLLERYIRQFPARTLAVLVPTNDVGYRMAALLAERGIVHDELLESSAQARGLAGVLAALLAFAADPLDREALAHSLEALAEEELLALPEPAESERLARLLRSRLAPERLLYPTEGQDPLEALPAGRATPQDLEALIPLFNLLRRTLQAAALPVDQFVLVLAAELFGRPAEHEPDPGEAESPASGRTVQALATAQQIAAYMRRLAQSDPTLRLPDLAEELERIARGRRRFVGLTGDDLGFEPKPGRVTVATQHRAKGLEWDLVCIVGVDRYWVPHDLEQSFQGSYAQLGGNPTAMVQARLRALMGDPDAPADPDEATREANLETIAERLRLLYVGITRARRHLQIGWSQAVEIYGRDREQEYTPILVELARFKSKT